MKHNTSKFLSLILRHRPEVIGITLDEHGWADVQELIDGINRAGQRFLDWEMLEEIVRTDEKGRYSFNGDHTLIRANQGHSVPVDVELEEKCPPDVLWHGTGEKSVPSIDEQGLLPKGRLYVHLSSDIGTARKVGSRHGRPVIYQVDCKKMATDGYSFYLSANQVWLTKEVPVRYLSKLYSARKMGMDAKLSAGVKVEDVKDPVDARRTKNKKKSAPGKAQEKKKGKATAEKTGKNRQSCKDGNGVKNL